jgi:hypothetical protein
MNLEEKGGTVEEGRLNKVNEGWNKSGKECMIVLDLK